MKGVVEGEKMHPSFTRYAGWSPALKMYIMNTLESDSFVMFSNYYEITEEDYNHFLDEGYTPKKMRFLFSSGDPHRRNTGESKRLHDIFFEIEEE